LKKFFIIILQIIIILFLASIIINNSFIISFEFKDFIYSISSSYILILLLVIFSIIFIFQSLYFKIKFSFSKYKLHKINKKKDIGYNSFVNGMIALSGRDYKKAISESKKVSNFLSDKPALNLLLKSEIYKVEKKYDKLNLVYQEMTKNKNTENLAFRGMMEQYLRAQDFHHAFIYGEKLFKNNPYIENIYDALIQIISKTKNWQELLSITEIAFNKKIINKRIFQENQSIAYFEIAKIKQYNEINTSIEYVYKALSLRKNFPPYIKFYIELLIQNKNYEKAKKFVRKSWKESPHQEYKSEIIELAKHLNVNLFEFVKGITKLNLQSEVSKLFLVEVSIIIKKWDIARNYIKELLDVKPKKEVCLLMAKIEEGDTGDIQKINSWSLRANSGQDNNVWVCMISNQFQDEWSSVSLSGHFNSLEWKQPFMISANNKSDAAINYENY